MLTEDYLVRQINLAIATLLQILGLKKKGDYQTALQLIDMTFENLLGLRSSMAKALDDDRLFFLLTRNDELDTRRLAIVADLLQEEGDIYASLGREPESSADYARALRFNLVVLFGKGEVDLVEIQQKVETLAGRLDLNSLGADTLWPLAGYYEENGVYAKAEALLMMLVERPDLRAGLLPEVIAFYQRLADLPPEKLAVGGVKLEEVRQRLAKWRKAT